MTNPTTNEKDFESEIKNELMNFKSEVKNNMFVKDPRRDIVSLARSVERMDEIFKKHVAIEVDKKLSEVLSSFKLGTLIIKSNYERKSGKKSQIVHDLNRYESTLSSCIDKALEKDNSQPDI